MYPSAALRGQREQTTLVEHLPCTSLSASHFTCIITLTDHSTSLEEEIIMGKLDSGAVGPIRSRKQKAALLTLDFKQPQFPEMVLGQLRAA